MKKSLMKIINRLTTGLGLLFIFVSSMNVHADGSQVKPQLDVKLMY